MLKFNKILFMNSLILSTLIAISSFSWLSMWMGLEINLLSLIPLLNTNKNIFSTEAMMKYFISQSLASMIFLFSIILMSSNFWNLTFLLMILNSSLLIKIGMAPFHFWFPPVVEGLNWNLSLIILTWQKIAPFILISYNLTLNWYFMMIIIYSASIGSIMGLNQISLRKILVFSSINHMSWMLTSLMNSISLWLIYFSSYTLITFNIIFIFKKLNIFYIKQLLNKMNHYKLIKLFLMINFLTLGGLPPLLGFLPKWLTVNFLLNQNLNLIALILILSSLITLFFYLRLILSSMILTHQENLNINYPLTSWFLFNLWNFINISSLIMITLIFNLY